MAANTTTVKMATLSVSTEISNSAVGKSGQWPAQECLSRDLERGQEDKYILSDSLDRLRHVDRDATWDRKKMLPSPSWRV